MAARAAPPFSIPVKGAALPLPAAPPPPAVAMQHLRRRPANLRQRPDSARPRGSFLRRTAPRQVESPHVYDILVSVAHGERRRTQIELHRQLVDLEDVAIRKARGLCHVQPRNVTRLGSRAVRTVARPTQHESGCTAGTAFAAKNLARLDAAQGNYAEAKAFTRRISLRRRKAGRARKYNHNSCARHALYGPDARRSRRPYSGREVLEDQGADFVLNLRGRGHRHSCARARAERRAWVRARNSPASARVPPVGGHGGELSIMRARRGAHYQRDARA